MNNELEIKELKLFKKGKVRNVYDLGQQLLMVATDRISCFDFILPTPIPDKGKILTQVSLFWFSFLKDTIENHLISTNPKDLPDLVEDKNKLKGRFMITKKCEVVPFECVVRGYLSGSGWKEYKTKQSVCGIKLQAGLKESSKLVEVLFTPATKAETGHDENVSFDYMKNSIGEDLANKIRDISITIYNKASGYAASKGVIIADTKFEFGIYNDTFILIDEVLTPDSSRFWPKDDYEPGRPQLSFDKQFVRDYLEVSGWDKTPPVPVLPDAVVFKTQEKYKQVLKMITGADFVE
ncbi:MAG: phosphoribosylaminoimidazolesuccinocarboxamide synthase [Candidatus Omnitrophica bacterium]|nr:phosphoribosylaminoimidazolesuccinocarboxamide synthase [Candidatus Omnitrophota bacterium]